jgi:2'-5' RNA ligase superfamily
VQPFSFELISVESFDDSIIYLAPSPAEPFVELTNKLWSAFPEFPPFGGQFDSVIPHMSVGGADLGATKETVTEQLAGALPIGATARHVTLLIEDRDGWTLGGKMPLGG